VSTIPTPTPASPRLPTPPARAVGVALAAGLGLVALATGRKPLHAVGRTWAADLRIDAPQTRLGVPLLRDRGVHPCTVRVSRAVGTPEGWWDIGGLALRLPGAGTAGRPADLLFATTGTGRVTRHLLRPVRRAAGRPLTTLLPTRAGGHTMALLVQPVDDEPAPQEFELAVAVDRGAWDVVGLLQLRQERFDSALRFDPIVDELEGTTAPAWVVALREPAYRWARRLSRHGRRTRDGVGLSARSSGAERSLEGAERSLEGG
jgi:hypothetical protein